jgi:DNA polymerase-1
MARLRSFSLPVASPQADKLRLYKSIATMDKSAPLPSLRNQKPTWDRAAKLAHDWQLNKLAERLEALADAA